MARKEDETKRVIGLEVNVLSSARDVGRSIFGQGDVPSWCDTERARSRVGVVFLKVVLTTVA